MTDREKIVKALECCVTLSYNGTKCANCEYADEFNNAECETYLLRDALALLKRESIKPTVEHNPAGQPMWCCGNCGTTLFFKFPRQTDDEDERKHYRFCYYCGMAVKWE